ncbi:MAG: hypothetical protein NZM09_12490, partial [Ignavibacterium sp.]|nr:hypothetical protein [Ignavibacterium sp.]MDW8376494.1 hypothetical protein [Ignavibacteriales bacterium]
AIEDNANKNAYRKEDIYEIRIESIFENWNILKPSKWSIASRTHKVKIGEKYVYDENIYLKNLKSKLINKFSKIVNNLHNKSREVLQNYLSDFEIAVVEIINERKRALENEKIKKQSNDELIAEINELELKKKEIIPMLKRAEEILEDLK